jgi:hypothetical protein
MAVAFLDPDDDAFDFWIDLRPDIYRPTNVARDRIGHFVLRRRWVTVVHHPAS